MRGRLAGPLAAVATVGLLGGTVSYALASHHGDGTPSARAIHTVTQLPRLPHATVHAGPAAVAATPQASPVSFAWFWCRHADAITADFRYPDGHLSYPEGSPANGPDRAPLCRTLLALATHATAQAVTRGGYRQTRTGAVVRLAALTPAGTRLALYRLAAGGIIYRTWAGGWRLRHQALDGTWLRHPMRRGVTGTLGQDPVQP